MSLSRNTQAKISQNLGTPKTVKPGSDGPTGFRWLIPGLLGGCPRPGMVDDIRRDFAALQRVGTRLLVTLTHEWQIDPVPLAEYGINSLYSPVVDLCPPTLNQAELIHKKVVKYTSAGKAVVFHCHAGRGRTGTLLAAMLMFGGLSNQEAVSTTRSKNPHWIETESQLAFLSNLAAFRSF